jgi:putative peptidoglycan lipid II flippase
MKYHLIKSSGIFGLMTFFSRILGLVRDMVTAYVFGAGPGYDAFILALRIPNLMRRLFAEGAFSQAFVPIISTYKQQQEHAQVSQFISRVSGALGIVVLSVSVIGMCGAPLIIKLFAPGFTYGSTKMNLAIDMLRITFPYIFFISLTALIGSILNAYGRFGAAAFTPIFLNVCMIIASLYCVHLFVVPEKALAWGVCLGGIVQFVFLLGFLRRDNLLVWPSLCWQDPGVKKILTLMAPAIFGASVNQINIMIDTLFASFLPNGSISWLYYSDRLMEFPLGIFGVGFATVILPNLSRLHAAKAKEEFSATLDLGIRCVLIVGIPATLGLYFLAGPLLATLFQSGKFSVNDVIMSSHSLMAYALAVVGIMLSKMLSSAFYACQNIKTPVRISVVILISNVVLISIFIYPLKHAGLALATSLSSILNAAILLVILHRKKLYQLQPGWQLFLLRLVVANISLCFAIKAVTPSLNEWVIWSTRTRVYWLIPIVVLGILVYIGVLFMCGLRLRDLAGSPLPRG